MSVHIYRSSTFVSLNVNASISLKTLIGTVIASFFQTSCSPKLSSLFCHNFVNPRGRKTIPFVSGCLLGDNHPLQVGLREKHLHTQICAKEVLSHASSWTENATPGRFKACINQNNFCADLSVRMLISQVCWCLNSSTSTNS